MHIWFLLFLHNCADNFIFKNLTKWMHKKKSLLLTIHVNKVTLKTYSRISVFVLVVMDESKLTEKEAECLGHETHDAMYGSMLCSTGSWSIFVWWEIWPNLASFSGNWISVFVWCVSFLFWMDTRGSLLRYTDLNMLIHFRKPCYCSCTSTWSAGRGRNRPHGMKYSAWHAVKIAFATMLEAFFKNLWRTQARHFDNMQWNILENVNLSKA